MTDNERDIGVLLRTAERPRALTHAERHRLLRQLGATNAPTLAHQMDGLTELLPPEPSDRARRRFASPLILAGCSVAAVAILFFVLTARDPVPREPARPISEPTATLPTPDDVGNAFCAEHVDAVSEALVRWRSVDNWAWARGEPDLAQLVDTALEAASALNDQAIATKATTALDRLRDELADADSSLSNRDSVAPTVAAMEGAIASLSSIASDLTPPCNVEQLAATPDSED